MIRNVCLFVYDGGQGLVDAYVLRYIAALRVRGADVTGMAESQQHMLPVINRHMLREHHG